MYKLQLCSLKIPAERHSNISIEKSNKLKDESLGLKSKGTKAVVWFKLLPQWVGGSNGSKVNLSPAEAGVGQSLATLLFHKI